MNSKSKLELLFSEGLGAISDFSAGKTGLECMIRRRKGVSGSTDRLILKRTLFDDQPNSTINCADPIEERFAMSDDEAIGIAKTEFREAYNTANVDRVLSVFADSFTDMSESQASFYGAEAKTALRWRVTNFIRRVHGKIGSHHYCRYRAGRYSVRLGLAQAHIKS